MTWQPSSTESVTRSRRWGDRYLAKVSRGTHTGDLPPTAVSVQPLMAQAPYIFMLDLSLIESKSQWARGSDFNRDHL